MLLLLRVRLVRVRLRVRLLLLMGSTELSVFCLRGRSRRDGRRGRRVRVDVESAVLVVVHSDAGPRGTAATRTLPGSPP